MSFSFVPVGGVFPVLMKVETTLPLITTLSFEHFTMGRSDGCKELGALSTLTGNTPPTGTKENDTSLHLEMMDQF